MFEPSPPPRNWTITTTAPRFPTRNTYPSTHRSPLAAPQAADNTTTATVTEARTITPPSRPRPYDTRSGGLGSQPSTTTSYIKTPALTTPLGDFYSSKMSYVKSQTTSKPARSTYTPPPCHKTTHSRNSAPPWHLFGPPSNPTSSKCFTMPTDTPHKNVDQHPRSTRVHQGSLLEPQGSRTPASKRKHNARGQRTQQLFPFTHRPYLHHEKAKHTHQTPQTAPRQYHWNWSSGRQRRSHTHGHHRRHTDAHHSLAKHIPVIPD